MKYYESLFNKCYWENWIPRCKKCKAVAVSHIYTKVNKKCIQYLEILLENMKYIEETMAKILQNWTWKASSVSWCHWKHQPNKKINVTASNWRVSALQKKHGLSCSYSTSGKVADMWLKWIQSPASHVVVGALPGVATK